MFFSCFRFLRILLILLIIDRVFGFGYFSRFLKFFGLFFLLCRVPWVYGLLGFVTCIFFFVFFFFGSSFFCRMGTPSVLASSFVPGRMGGLGVLVWLVEVFSYLVRPFVMMLRPLVNLGIGYFGLIALLSRACW